MRWLRRLVRRKDKGLHRKASPEERERYEAEALARTMAMPRSIPPPPPVGPF